LYPMTRIEYQASNAIYLNAAELMNVKHNQNVFCKTTVIFLFVQHWINHSFGCSLPEMSLFQK
jgi:hypothetical protein